MGQQSLATLLSFTKDAGTNESITAKLALALVLMNSARLNVLQISGPDAKEDKATLTAV